MKILIADDLLNNRKLLVDILKIYGQCDTVSDGQEAVEVFEDGLVDDEPYSLVLLDLLMPRLNGQQALEKIRRLEREQHVLKEAIIFMVTAIDTTKNVLQAFYQGGCDDYIVKPINKDDLVKKLIDCNLVYPSSSVS
ncbi:MAG: response regulator [Magnetococcus sp. YQC-3]